MTRRKPRLAKPTGLAFDAAAAVRRIYGEFPVTMAKLHASEIADSRRQTEAEASEKE